METGNESLIFAAYAMLITAEAVLFSDSVLSLTDGLP